MIKINKVMATLGVLLFSAQAFAEEGSMMADSGSLGYLGLAAGLGMGLAVFGAASGQGKAAAAALEGIARNPSASGNMFLPLILSLVLMESLVILAFLVSFVSLGGSIGSMIGH